jgi:hypothetical protein
MISTTCSRILSADTAARVSLPDSPNKPCHALNKNSHFVQDYIPVFIFISIYTLFLHISGTYFNECVPWVKQPGSEANYSSPTNTEVKNTWIYTSIPLYAFME